MRRSTSVYLLRSLPAVWVLLGLITAMTHVHGEAGDGHASHAYHTGHAGHAGHADDTFAGSEAGLETSGETPTVSSDDAHDEHSSTTRLAAELCLGCRSRHEVDHALDDAHPALAATSPRSGAFAGQTPTRSDALARAYAARAPPLARA